MSDWDWVGGDGSNEQPDSTGPTGIDWKHLGTVIANHLGHGAVTGAGFAADALSHMLLPGIADAINKPADVMSGQGVVTRATDKAYKAVAGDVQPRNKTEQYAASASEGAGSAIVGGVNGWTGLARALVAGGAAGVTTQAINDKFPGHEGLANIAGLVTGAVVGAHGSRVNPVSEGMAHPEFNILADRVVPTLEGGGTFEHPLTNPDSGAMGPMQVTPETARDPGYGIKPWDGKTQEDLARVGREKLAVMLHRYDGDTSKALAAYNWGEGNVDKAVARHGDNWLDHAPEETQNYVNRGMAMTYGGGATTMHFGSTGHTVQPMTPDQLSEAMGPPRQDLAPVEPETPIVRPEGENPVAPEQPLDQGAKAVVEQTQKTNELLDSHLGEAHQVMQDIHDGEPLDITPYEVANYRQGAQDILNGLSEKDPLRYKAEKAVNMWDNISAHFEGDAIAAKPELDPFATEGADKFLGQEPHDTLPANDPAALERDQNPPAASSNFGTASPESTINTEAPKSPEGHEAVPTPSNKDPVDVLVEALSKATSKLGAQDKLTASQRKERLAKVHQAAESKLTGVAKSHAMLAALKGPMDRIDFESIANEIHPDDLNALHDAINNHPSLNGYEKIAAINGLNKLTHPEGGTLPYHSEVDALGKVFPKVVNVLKTNKSLWQKIKEGTAEVANLSRALMTTLDLSAPFTQASALIGHKEFWTNMPTMVKAMFSKEFHDAMWSQIQRDPYFKYAERGKVSFTKVDGPLSEKEEAFMSHLAQKIPGIGVLVKGSDRAYVTYLNKLRLDVFKKIMQQEKELGVNVKDPKFLNDLGGFVNNATGRGNLGRYNSSAPLLSAAFFSPRMQMSRVALINPIYYMQLHPAVRMQAIKTMLGFGAIMATAYGLAWAGGAKVSLNPDDPDFLKVRIGDTRLGNFGAFAPWIRIGYKVAAGFYDQATGVKTKNSVGDDILHFARTKLSPVAGTAVDIAQKGKEVTGINIKDEKFLGLHGTAAYIAQKYVPMILQDIHDAVESSGPAGVGVTPFAALGIPVQTYKDKPKASTGKSPWDFASGGGGSPWDYAAKAPK